MVGIGFCKVAEQTYPVGSLYLLWRDLWENYKIALFLGDSLPAIPSAHFSVVLAIPCRFLPTSHKEKLKKFLFLMCFVCAQKLPQSLEDYPRHIYNYFESTRKGSFGICGISKFCSMKYIQFSTEKSLQ